jgi:cyanate permease
MPNLSFNPSQINNPFALAAAGLIVVLAVIGIVLRQKRPNKLARTVIYCAFGLALLLGITSMLAPEKKPSGDVRASSLSGLTQSMG